MAFMWKVSAGVVSLVRRHHLRLMMYLATTCCESHTIFHEQTENNGNNWCTAWFQTS